MSKRKKLEERAKELGLSFVPDTSDEDLQQLINDFQNDDESNDKPDSQEFGSDFLFFKSLIPGLSIQIGDTPERDQQPDYVRFTAYEFFDEKKGEHFSVGYLATDETDAIEVMADDPNVEEINEAEYREATETGKLAKT